MAQSHWLSVIHPPTSCEVRITADGSVECFTAAQDIGTGTRTVLAQVVAEELGLQADQIGSYIGDTRYPMGPPSGGSRVTGSLTPAARNAAYRVARDLATRLAPQIGVKAEAIVFGDGHVGVPGGPSTWLTFSDAVREAGVVELAHRAGRRDDYEGYMMVTPEFAVGKHGIGGVQFAEVLVDTETGVVKVQRIVAVHDCGRPINPKLTESQIYGGVTQGVSYALYEERHLDDRSGLHLNANVDQYKMVGSREVPDIEVQILEQLTGQSSTDARGVAEPANVATAAAIANGFYNATGVRIRTLPMTPANVLSALRPELKAAASATWNREGLMQSLEWVDANSVEHAAAPLAEDSPAGPVMAKAGGIDLLLQRPRCWYVRSAHFHQDGFDAAAAAIDGENQYHAIFDNAKSAMVHASTPATALVAYGAEVDLTNQSRRVRTVALKDFLLPAGASRDRDAAIERGEVLTRVRIPAVHAGTRSAYHKQTERESYAWPICDVAVVLQMDGEIVRDAAIVLGWVAPTPRRAIDSEQIIRGRKLTGDIARDAAAAAVRGATPLSKNAYKVPVLETVVRRTILAASNA